MKKHDKRHDQSIFNDEDYIREHTRVVRAPRLQPKQKEGMMQPEKKPKGMKNKSGQIPSM